MLHATGKLSAPAQILGVLPRILAVCDVFDALTDDGGELDAKGVHALETVVLESPRAPRQAPAGARIATATRIGQHALGMPFTVTTSRMMQTNATVLWHGGETLVVDAPYFPDELAALRAAVAGPVRLLATHSHYDHLLARLAFPDAPLLVGMPTAQALAHDPERPLSDLAADDARHYVTRESPLRFGAMQGVAVPGDVEVGGEWADLVPTPGHTVDGCALWAPWAGLLCCGDYLSDVEIPLVSEAGSPTQYRASLERLRPLVEAARAVVPGHGSVATAAQALRRLEQDVAYLDALAAGDPDQRLPPGRDTPRQREIHRGNIERHVERPKPPAKKRPKKRPAQAPRG